MQAPAIEDYFVIGDLFSAALVTADGSIDWLCLPYFDSPSLFARMLDGDAGHFAIDTEGYEVSCAYVPETAIVRRTLTKPGARVEVLDFMAPRSQDAVGGSQYLVRKLAGTEGRADIVFNFFPKPGYGSDRPEITQDDERLELSVGTDRAVLHLSPGATAVKVEGGYRITVPVEAGKEASLVLEYAPATAIAQDSPPGDLQEHTQEYWRQWVEKGTFVDFCRDNLVRSAITLKLMQFAPTGAMIAAPTTSLPEELGGSRNWDYRYVWIRDATFTLYAFDILGYTDEARQFFDYISGIVEKCSHEEFDVSLMYTIFGEPVPEETTLEHMAGYRGSRPVRIGNGAADQFQLDVYGALIDAYYFASEKGLTHDEQQRDREMVMNLVRKIDERWQDKDSGIWEVRSGTQHYTYSKVMSWVGADRAQRLQEHLGLSDEDVRLCTDLAGTIKRWIWDNSYEAATTTMRQHPETKDMDSTNFLFVLLQFLDKHDPQTREIIDLTCEALCHKDIFVYRYTGDDGLPGNEGAFVLCSFWLISALAILEDTDEALKLFRQMEKLIAPHGLLSEELDPDTHAYLGNYPQAFSHLGYILSAHYLNKYLNRKQETAG